MENIADIYFDKNYGKLYEKIEKGKAKIFEYQDENGKISNQFIIKEIPINIDNNKYFDIVTPYGYGGPIIENCIEGKKENLVKCYEKAFNNYCSENNVVSEFVRFHPIINNVKDFEKIYDTKLLRHTLGTNLDISNSPMEEEFSKSCRKTIRQVLKKGIDYRIIENVTDFSEFKRIYYLNMDRKNADSYYYFDDEYYENMNKYFHNNIIQVQAIYENKVVAEGLYFIYNKIIHAHLSGTDTEYLHLSPAYILKYGTAIWGKENGYKLIHYGGGTSNSLEDPLYLFKKKFAQNTEFDFYIGKKIWNKEIYNKLCRVKKVDENEEFFPAYRKEQK